MSTYWGYVCLSHTPPLTSEHWFNHGTELLTEAYRLERAGQWPNDPAYEPDGEWNLLGPEPQPVVKGSYATKDPVWWLRDHPNCTIGLHNEYGVTEPLPGGVA